MTTPRELDEPRFPTKDEIAAAHAKLGIDPTSPEWVCCDKCGAPIETGLIVAFCPFKKRCEFYDEGIDAFVARLDGKGGT